MLAERSFGGNPQFQHKYKIEMSGSTEIARNLNFHSNSNHATSKARLLANQGQQNNSKVAANYNSLQLKTLDQQSAFCL